MHFDSGKFGAIVVVLSIVLTIVIGYCSDVTKVEVEKTDYDYITDITGLFETEQVPEYIDYNPNSNYVGYTGPVVYEVSNQPNNYRFESAPGTTDTDGDLLYYNEIRAIPTEMSPMSAVYLNYTGSSYSLTSQFSSGTGGTYNVYTFVNTNVPSVTTLKEIIDNAEINLSGYRTLEIDFSFTNVNYPVFAFPSFSSFVVQDAGGIKIWTANATDNNIVDRMVIDVTTLSVRAYRGSVEVWTGIANTIPVVYSYQANNYTGSQTSDNVPITLDMDFALTTPPVYSYADPTSGVTYDRDRAYLGSVIWNNGYVTESIRMLVGRNPNTSGEWSVGYFGFEGLGSFGILNSISFRIAWNPNGELVIGIGEGLSLGKWQGAIIDFNYITGKLVITPTGTIRDYTEVPTIQGDSYIYQETWEENNGTDYHGTRMYYTGTDSNKLRWGVQNTRVDLNTYDVVMNDPSINIQDYWPDLDYYRLNFYSYALVGDSVTFNGVTYPIGDGQTITVTDVNGKTYTDVLSNIYVTVNGEDGTKRTSLTFVDSRTTIDLGETVSEVVSYSGLWYFTTALYDAETVLVSEYEWNLDGDWSATSGQVLTIFLGLCVGGILIGRVFFKDSLGGWDYLVIGIAIVIAFAIAEVFV